MWILSTAFLEGASKMANAIQNPSSRDDAKGVTICEKLIVSR